jgi:UDP-N-acetylglucosamine transferase subunit ALG13
MIFVVVSTGHFDPLIKECERISPKFDFLAQTGSSLIKTSFPSFKMATPPQIESHMKQAELVVSHGGAGMTAMLYRLRKKAIIIPKQKRYGEKNDLQVELARKWGQLGMGEFILDVGDLEAAIRRCRKQEYQFPRFASLGQHLTGILGFESAARALGSTPAIG